MINEDHRVRHRQSESLVHVSILWSLTALFWLAVLLKLLSSFVCHYTWASGKRCKERPRRLEIRPSGQRES